MKITSSPAAATALAALYAKDKLLIERSFSHMTADALETLDQKMLQEFNENGVHQHQAIQLDDDDDGSSRSSEQRERERQCHLVLAQACIRRIAYSYLNKYASLQSSQQVVEDALKFHTLPLDLQERLAADYGSHNNNNNNNNKVSPPKTWYDALEQLKILATATESDSCDDGSTLLDKGKLWRLILDHPMTAYVPVQCQACGHVIPDQYPLQQTDDEIGLQEVPPTGNELEIRAGWFRGPRKAVVFQVTCPNSNCQGNNMVSKWYRSGHPQIILNPHKWGRLCGEQEDLRLTLAEYLKIPVRFAVPLDWDHVWSEYQASSSSTTTGSKSESECTTWRVQDDSARNFCCRLDEGIGNWTRVWAIHSNPDWCNDVTQDYLACQMDGGRADDRVSNDAIERYEKMVQNSQKDASGSSTQAKTCNGYVLERANLSDEEITRELQQAARDHGSKGWWQV